MSLTACELKGKKKKKFRQWRGCEDSLGAWFSNNKIAIFS